MFDSLAGTAYIREHSRGFATHRAATCNATCHGTGNACNAVQVVATEQFGNPFDTLWGGLPGTLPLTFEAPCEPLR
jgi:hypothetical protein